MNGEDSWIRDLLDLKRCPRTGWFRIGVDRPESVAEHSFAVGLLAWRMARERGLDADRALLMGLLHDFHEAQLGDIPKPSQARLGSQALTRAEAFISAEQWGQAPEIAALLSEFFSGTSELTKLVHAADGIELLLQARRYRAEGYAGAEAFIAELEASPELESWLRLPWLQGDEAP